MASPTPDERGPKERVYDDEIRPLMDQIIAACTRADIPLYASFALDGDLACSTYIVPPDERISDEDREHFDWWKRKFGARASQIDTAPQMFAYTITHKYPKADNAAR